MTKNDLNQPDPWAASAHTPTLDDFLNYLRKQGILPSNEPPTEIAPATTAPAQAAPATPPSWRDTAVEKYKRLMTGFTPVAEKDIFTQASRVNGEILRDLNGTPLRATTGDPIELYKVVNALKGRPVDYENPPISGRISSEYGYRFHPILKYRKLHEGVDIAASQGTPIPSMFDGKVERAAQRSGYGNTVLIAAGKDAEGRDIKVEYCHLSKYGDGIEGMVGTMIPKGRIVGYVGSTGLSTGPHLHYNIYVNGTEVNPLTFRWANRPPVKK